MRALLNGVAGRMGLLLAPWPGLLLGLLVLHGPEWPAALASGLGAGAAAKQLLGSDALLLLRLLPLWCLLGLPLTWLGQTPRTVVLGLAGSLLLLAQAGLSHYFLTAGVPLGADLLGYSLAEIQTTVSGGAGPLPLALLASLGLALALYWAGLLWLARQPTRTLPAPLAAGTLGLCLLGSAALPLQWPMLASGLVPVTSNKLGYFASDIVSKRLLRTAVAPATANASSAHPFEHAETTPDTLGPLLALREAQPHVVLIVVEGLGRSFSGPGARLGSFTPFLDELASRSLYWDNFLATQGRTFAVLPSILASLPFGQDNAQLPPHDNLPRLLAKAGYSLRYFSGSNLAFDHQGDYLSASGVQSQWSERDFGHPERRLSEWGYADGDLLQAVSAAPAVASPSFTLVQTMSMHTPFVVPEQERYRQRVDARLDQLGVAADRREPYQRQRDIYASILYTDEALRGYFQRLEKTPEWNNTIVLITGDHRLPEIPMDTRLERYHVPLIVASPLLEQPRRIRALSSHFDMAPALLAMLSKRYGMQTPARTHWMGTGLDVQTEWRNLHRLPLKQTKTDLDDYVSGTHYLGQDRLYALNDGLQPEPEENPAVRERLRQEFARLRGALATLEQSRQLLPPAAAGQLASYSPSTRTLEPPDRAASVQGVVVTNTQGRWLPDGRIEASGQFTQHGADAPVFVPLLVLTDASGKQLGEAYGQATRMQAGQASAVRLQMQPGALPAGKYYLAMIVSHPDTGKPIGKGQYRVEVQR